MVNVQNRSSMKQNVYEVLFIPCVFFPGFFPEVYSDFFPSTLLVFLDGVVPGVLPVIGVSLRDLFPSTRLSEEKKETLENLK